MGACWRSRNRIALAVGYRRREDAMTYLAIAGVVPYDAAYEWQTLIDAADEADGMEQAREFARSQVRPIGTSVRVRLYGPFKYDEDWPVAEGFLG
jgi:hypothetical protein